jgi:hypothetical protein
VPIEFTEQSPNERKYPLRWEDLEPNEVYEDDQEDIVLVCEGPSQEKIGLCKKSDVVGFFLFDYPRSVTRFRGPLKATFSFTR